MKIAVVGGGVIGLSIAWRCAERGASVTVIDPAPGSGASWVAGGMLAPVAEAYRGEEAVTALGVESARRWPAFAAALAGASGVDPGFTTEGTLVVARDGDDTGELTDLFALQRAAGLPAERVTSRAARRLEPALGPAIRGALWLPEDHQIDNRLLLRALKAACDRVSVGFVAESATAIAPSSVTVASGVSIGADVVVVATGAQVPPLVGFDGAAGDADTSIMPVRPVKGQILRVRSTPTAVCPTRTVRGVDVYIIPRAHGEIAIGATSEEKGFDTTVTAGAVMDLLRDAWELCPGLAEAEFVEAIAGLRPGTPDNAPLIGWWGPGERGSRRSPAGPAGSSCLVAMGHYRHGVLLAPITADAVSAWVFGPARNGEDGIDAAALAPFDPMRFASTSPAALFPPSSGSAASTGAAGSTLGPGSTIRSGASA